MARTFLSDPAKRDLVDIWDFICQDDYLAADRFIDKLKVVFLSLSDNPKMGRSRSVDFGVPDLRSFPVGGYVIYYFPSDESGGVVIVRIFHGARDIEGLLDE